MCLITWIDKCVSLDIQILPKVWCFRYHFCGSHNYRNLSRWLKDAKMRLERYWRSSSGDLILLGRGNHPIFSRFFLSGVKSYNPYEWAVTNGKKGGPP